MEMVNLEVSLPKELFLTMGITKTEAAKEMRGLVVLEMFKKGKVSSGKAAELLGMRKRDFIEFLDKEGIPFFDYTKEELEEEFKTVDLLVKSRGKL